MAQYSSVAPVANPIAIISPQYCAPYPVELAMVRKVMTLADNLAVTDINGNIIFKVKEHRGKKLILDPAGNPIVTLRRKAMSAHSRRQAFRGESTDPKDLLFNAKTHSVMYLKTKLDVFLANNTEEKVCDFKVKGSFSERSCVVYAGDEDSTTMIAQMHKKHTAKSIFLGKDNFMVTVYPNIDYAFIVALIVILDDINREAAGAAASAGADAGASAAAAAAGASAAAAAGASASAAAAAGSC